MLLLTPYGQRNKKQHAWQTYRAAHPAEDYLPNPETA
jgi:hypothetical protein